ncbi:large conductance mechanosensitive channel protein MscL [Candidatus Parcubacteria bacterium]|nr:MAG: large conductance mechanosensitive channel protein MscL [Candidatus Parcubacteria bacterium]
MKLLDEFKSFAIKGNVLDLAVAVVIGAAFGKIVSSFVADIITPLLGVLTGGLDYSGLQYQVGDAVVTYGVFIQSVIDFFVIAFAIFLVVKQVNRFKKKEEIKEESKPSNEELLLKEIRDELRKR